MQQSPARAQLLTDLVIAGYLVATVVPIFLARSEVAGWLLFLTAHLAGAVLLVQLRRLPQPLHALWLFLRDWYPVFLFPLLYKEVELLAAGFGNWGLTPLIIDLEERLFAGQPAAYLAETYPWLLLSEYLHLCYFAHLALLPVVGGTWYFGGKRRAFHEMLLVVSVIYAVCFLFYISFPVDSPFYLVENPGEPISSGPLFQLVHFFSERGGARGGAFPSTHVAISTGIWLVCWRRDRRLAKTLVLMVPGLYLATVYGRFHYALDVVAGWAVGIGLFYLVCRVLKEAGPARWPSA